jgi:hypothetical protein
VYVRQSARGQVLEHTESTRLQYALAGRAVALGWARSQVIVIDDDLGVSAAVPDSREGFARLVTEVTMGRAGVVLGIEMSRLARTGKDWHHLLTAVLAVRHAADRPGRRLRPRRCERPRAAGVIRPRLTGVFNVAQRSGAPPATVAGDWLSSPCRQRLQGGADGRLRAAGRAAGRGQDLDRAGGRPPAGGAGGGVPGVSPGHRLVAAYGPRVCQGAAAVVAVPGAGWPRLGRGGCARAGRVRHLAAAGHSAGGGAAGSGGGRAAPAGGVDAGGAAGRGGQLLPLSP